jgi:hypothetical protein
MRSFHQDIFLVGAKYKVIRVGKPDHARWPIGPLRCASRCFGRRHIFGNPFGVSLRRQARVHDRVPNSKNCEDGASNARINLYPSLDGDRVLNKGRHGRVVGNFQRDAFDPGRSDEPYSM